MDQLVRTLLVSDKVSETLVKALVEVFGKLHPPQKRLNELAVIISEIREPECREVERPLSEDEQRKRKLQVKWSSHKFFFIIIKDDFKLDKDTFNTLVYYILYNPELRNSQMPF